MKKILIVASILVLILVLTACSNGSNTSADDDLFEQANALMEEGKYDEALNLYRSIESYQKVAAKIAEAEYHIAEASNAFLYTKWIDINHDDSKQFDDGPMTVSFHEDGSAYERKGTTEYVCRFIWENGEIAVIASTQVVILRLSVEEIDGVMHLKGPVGSHDCDFVPEADYERLKQG